MVDRTDSYVEVCLINHSKSSVGSQRTRVEKNSFDPTFNQTLEFMLPDGALGLNSTELKFKVMESHPPNQDEVIGVVQTSLSQLEFDRLILLY